MGMVKAALMETQGRHYEVLVNNMGVSKEVIWLLEDHVTRSYRDDAHDMLEHHVKIFGKIAEWAAGIDYFVEWYGRKFGWTVEGLWDELQDDIKDVVNDPDDSGELNDATLYDIWEDFKAEKFLAINGKYYVLEAMGYQVNCHGDGTVTIVKREEGGDES